MMKNKKFMAGIFAVALTASLIVTDSCGYILPISNNIYQVAAKENTENEKYMQINIGTAEELESFAKECHDAQWSADKYVKLIADIDLSESEFLCIPAFNGYFDGNGHTISGYHYDKEGYNIGFFRYIGEMAIVNDLVLKGSVTGEDEKQSIGGICGRNQGTIRNCEFYGMVNGKTQTGGIAGVNESTGTIQRCVTKGRITGYYYTGGITGRNYGTIDNCTNYANINDSGDWVKQDDEMGVDIFQNINSNSLSVKLQSGVDTGGIAGYSNGMVTRCNNNGIIGYERTGYNIGGIVGRQSGVVSYCTNNGTVYGRKDIGGIVGQVEPYIELDESESVRSEVNKLHDLIDKTINDMGATKDTVKADVDQLKTYSDQMLDTGDEIADTMVDFIDESVEQINNVSERVDNVLERIPSIMDYTDLAKDSLDKFNDNLAQINKDLNISGSLSSNPYDETEYKRLSLNAGIGGSVITDSLNPEEGSTVNVTLKEYNGYTLKNMTVTDSFGNNITTNYDSYGKFSFIMPHNNVVINAEFFYSGAYLASSTPGGDIKVTNNQDGETITIQTEAADGFTAPTQIYINETTPVTLTDGKVTVTKTDYRNGYDNVFVYGEFIKDNSSSFWDASTEIDSYGVKTVCSTGGSVLPSAAAAKAGESIAIAYSTKQGYRLSRLNVKTLAGGNDVTVTLENNRYNFVMPSEDVVIEAVFAPIQLTLLSNVGGSASYSEENGVITLSVSPNSGYSVTQNPSIRDCNGAEIEITNVQQNTFTYKFALAQDREPATASITFTKQNQSDAGEAALDRINANTELLNQQMDKISAKAQELNEDLKDSNGNFDESKLKDPKTWNDIMDMAEYMADAGETAAQLVSDMVLLSNLYGPYISDALSDANGDIDKALSNINDVSKHLSGANSGLRGIVDYLNAQAKIEFSKLGEEFDQKTDQLHNQLTLISDCIGRLTDNASDYSDLVNKDLKAVNNQINVVFNLVIDKADEVSRSDINAFYKDISDEEIEQAVTGLVDECSNKGTVKGDINIGGIAGSMSIDEEDPEENAAGEVESFLGNSYTALCIVKNCNNRGVVSANKDGAGGIAGYMRQGIISKSLSEGLIESKQGDYVGGICGESFTSIRSCYSVCSIYGNKNVGGIAGYGSIITDCYALTTIDAKGRYGAIAGQIEVSDDLQNVKNNYYVDNGIFGIDSISYDSQAKAITYEELLQTENIPSNFSHLKVIFKVDDMYLGTQEIKYGESLLSLNFPIIPEKNGAYGTWPDVSELKMTSSMVIEGEYEDNITVLESEEKFENNKAKALIEAVFTSEAVLHALESDVKPDEQLAGMGAKTTYEILLENSKKTNVDTMQIRLYNPYQKASLWKLENGEWKETDCKIRGQYVQTEITGTGATFCIVNAQSNSKKIVMLVVIILLLLIIMLGIVKLIKSKIRKNKNKKKNKIKKNVSKSNQGE